LRFIPAIRRSRNYHPILPHSRGAFYGCSRILPHTFLFRKVAAPCRHYGVYGQVRRSLLSSTGISVTFSTPSFPKSTPSMSP